MKKYLCNPINVNYRYQFNQDIRTQKLTINREAADPSLICFHGRYYLFASMTLGVWVSDDLVHWENHRLPDDLPLYGYAPDVRVLGDYVYYCSSSSKKNCDRWRTKDILQGPYEKIEGTFPFWDPNLFVDDDGRVYFYWGCSSEMPIYGVELDPVTMLPRGEKKALISGDPYTRGYERVGVDHSTLPRTEEEIDQAVRQMLSAQGMTEEALPPDVLPMIRGMFSQKPFIEGAWMDKFQGKYYLQYACPGTEYNTYADGVFIGSSPLGPFKPAKNNPYSYHPGGFMPGAGHGSTMRDMQGHLWHTASMRISVQHPFERRVGLWPAGIDQDGELYCNQRYGDWPLRVDENMDPWRNPDWFLLSYGKQAYASSCTNDHGPENAIDENAQTWWQSKEQHDAWLIVDLGKTYHVHAIQINFADDQINIPIPGVLREDDTPRFIDDAPMVTRWLLEGSNDGQHFESIQDKSNVMTDLSHDLLILEKGADYQFIRLRVIEVPYGQCPCVSGLRVFGQGDGKAPEQAEYQAVRTGELDFDVSIGGQDALGWNILWGHAPDKLYHSYMVFSRKQHIGALVKGTDYYVRVDAFNENGITEGVCRPLMVEREIR